MSYEKQAARGSKRDSSRHTSLRKTTPALSEIYPVKEQDKPAQSSTSQLQHWPRVMLGMEALVAAAFFATASLAPRESMVPLALYATFWAVALVSTGVGLNALRATGNVWLLLYPVASIALLPCVWLFGVFRLFRFFPD